MKKLFLILMTAILVLSLTACSKDETPMENVDLSDPTLSITQCYKVPYQFDLTPYIDIDREDYIGIEIERVDMTVTDDDVNDAIFADLEEHATYVAVERGAQNGDSLNINFTGSVDGVEFDGGAAENYDMVLGQAGFIPGFEEALVGHAVGEEFTIDVTFPEDYGKEDLNGKAAQFKIKMNSVKEQVLPEFSLEFVKENYECESIEAYLTMLREELIAAKAVEADNAKKTEAYSKIYESVEFKDYPKEQYEFYYNDFVNYYTDLAKNYFDMDLETYITDYCNSTEDEFYYYADSNAAMNVSQELLCFAIANEEKLWQDLKKADYDEYIVKIAADNDMTVEAFEAQYGSDGVWLSLILDKTINFVLDNAIEVEPKPETETTEETTETNEESETTETTETTEE